MYALWRKCGVSRDTISRIEAGETIPGVHVLARDCCYLSPPNPHAPVSACAVTLTAASPPKIQG